MVSIETRFRNSNSKDKRDFESSRAAQNSIKF